MIEPVKNGITLNTIAARKLFLVVNENEKIIQRIPHTNGDKFIKSSMSFLLI